MIEHNVYFWLIDDLTPDDKKEFEVALSDLIKIENVNKGRYGVPAQTPDREGVTQNSYHYRLELIFDDVEDHNIYQKHTDHDKFVDNYGKWFKKVRVFDSAM